MNLPFIQNTYMTIPRIEAFKFMTIIAIYILVALVGVAMPMGVSLHAEASLAIILCLLSNCRVLPAIFLGALLVNAGTGIHNSLTGIDLIIATIIPAIGTMLQCTFCNKFLKVSVGSRWKRLFNLKDLAVTSLILIVLSSIIPVIANGLVDFVTQTIPTRTELELCLADWIIEMTSLIVFLPLFLSIYLRTSKRWVYRWRLITLGSLSLVSTMVIIASNDFGFQYWERKSSIDKQAEKFRRDFEIHSRELEQELQSFTRLAATLPKQNINSLEYFSRHLLNLYPEITSISVNSYVTDSNRLEYEHDWAQRLNDPNFKITQYDSNKTIVPASQYKTYLPASFIFNREHDLSHMGLDTLSDPDQSSALSEAFKKLKNDADFNMMLIHHADRSKLELINIFNPESRPLKTLLDLDESYRLTTVTIDSNIFLGMLLKKFPLDELNISIRLDTQPSSIQADTDHAIRPMFINQGLPDPRQHNLNWNQTIRTLGGDWLIDVSPTQQWFYSRTLKYQVPAELIRLLFFTIVQALIFIALSKNNGIKLLVAKQTKIILDRERGLELFRTSIQQSSDLIMICRVDPRNQNEPHIIYTNDSFKIRTGYSDSDLLNKPWSILQNELSDAEALASVRLALHGGYSASLELLSFTKMGDWFWQQLNITPLKNVAGEVTHWISIQRDMTERIATERLLRKSAEEAEAANIAKTRFLAAMSHEIRTPLSGVIGLTKLAQQQPVDAQTLNYLQNIQISAELQLQILTDILDFSKIEENAMLLDIHSFNLEQLLRESVTLFQPVAYLAGIELDLYISDNTAIHVYGDWLRLKQIISNLISNAIKFTEHGYVHVKAELMNIRESNVELRFSVIDTGAGLGALSLDELIEPFRQAKGTSASRLSGTGLGLTISEKLLNLMGSKLQYKKRFGGRGSHFFFDLKMIQSDSLTEIQNPSHPLVNRTTEFKTDLSPWQNAFTGIRILVAEDNKVTQLFMNRLLRITGAQVDIVAEGASAIAMFKENTYELILMDLQMPGIGGLEASKKMQLISPGHVTPIIGVSAGVSSDESDSCHDAGMVDFLQKPVDPVTLFKKIQQYVTTDTPTIPKKIVTPSQSSSRDNEAGPSVQQEILSKLKPIQQSDDTKLLQLFLNEIEITRRTITEQFTQNMPGPTLKILHEIKGSAATLHALSLMQSAQQLEQMINNNVFDEGTYKDFLNALTDCQNDVSEALKTAHTANMHSPVNIGQQPDATQPQPQPHIFKVLIVDDNEFVRVSLKNLLLSLGIKVDLCAGGHELLKQLMFNSYDLILMDVQMPGIDGIAATRLLKSQPLYNHITIIGLSAETSDSTINSCLEAGMKEVISKLSGPFRIMSTIENMMSHAGGRNQE